MVDKRFDILDNGEMTCNNQPMPPDDAVGLLNEADEIIATLYAAINFCIVNEVDLRDYNNNDELFCELEKLGVI